MVSLDDAHANEARLLKYLEEAAVQFQKYTHPVVMTVEEQAAQLSHVEGALAKNLFLKDKKGRLILVTALTSTSVDLKLLSQRLGLGKGGLRLAPLENLAAVLQVPEGSVTPLALFSSTARSIPLLLDQGFKNHPRILVHPLVNDSTIALTCGAFEKFLQSIGREANYVDLESVVNVGKDQPPDLADLLQAVGGDGAVATATTPGSAGKDTKGPQTAPSLVSKPAVQTSAKAEAKVAKAGPPGDDVSTCSDAILKLVGLIPASEAPSQGQSQQQKSQVVGGHDLREELEHILTMFKNSAYTNGFSAARAANGSKAW